MVSVTCDQRAIRRGQPRSPLAEMVPGLVNLPCLPVRAMIGEISPALFNDLHVPPVSAWSIIELQADTSETEVLACRRPLGDGAPIQDKTADASASPWLNPGSGASADRAAAAASDTDILRHKQQPTLGLYVVSPQRPACL